MIEADGLTLSLPRLSFGSAHGREVTIDVIIPPEQFGGVSSASAPDAGLAGVLTKVVTSSWSFSYALCVLTPQLL